MSGKVLMIDDSIPLHKLVESRLNEEGFVLSSAFDGGSGITLATVLRPSVILLDVDMPDMNGFEVCRQLKEKKETSSIPILFLTAENGLKNKVKGLDLGAADYVTKPFNAEELSARIRATMRIGRQLEKSAGIDPETGLWNRAFLSEHLKTQLSLSARTGSPPVVHRSGHRRVENIELKARPVVWRHGRPVGGKAAAVGLPRGRRGMRPGGRTILHRPVRTGPQRGWQSGRAPFEIGARNVADLSRETRSGFVQFWRRRLRGGPRHIAGHPGRCRAAPRQRKWRSDGVSGSPAPQARESRGMKWILREKQTRYPRREGK